MRANAAASQQITASFQISGSWAGPAQLPGFWKMHWASPALDLLSLHTGMLPTEIRRKAKANIAIGCLYNRLRNNSAEVQMHIGSAILVIWLIIGGFAAGQRGDYTGPVSCSSAATAAVTILAGALNYAGVNPHINCSAPSPSN